MEFGLRLAGLAWRVDLAVWRNTDFESESLS